MIDLHIHSNKSDGTLAPEEIIQKSSKLKLYAISITDHDSIDGLRKATTESKKYGINFIPGIEISSSYNGYDVHILGYFLNYNNRELINILAELKLYRKIRINKIVEKISNSGINININDIKNYNSDNSVGRIHVARALFEKGFVKNTNEAFEKYLIENSPFYVKKKMLDISEAVNLLKKSGAVVCLAHPGMNDAIKDIDKIMKLGFDGIESYHPLNNSEQTKMLLSFAITNNFLATGGSDNHGDNTSYGWDISQTNIPDEIYERLVGYRKKSSV